MLLLKKHLVELVRSGKKRQTIRLWSRPLLRAGQVSYTPGLGRMKITAIDQLPNLESLTEADALADGFDSLAALLREIQRIYGAGTRGRCVYRIRFEWPIDAAGEALVTTPAMVKTKRATPTAAARKPRGGGAIAMSVRQRQSLRAFVLSQAPGV